MMQFLRPTLVVIGLAFLASCASDEPVTTSDMWARPTAPDATNAAFYGTITNNSDQDITLEAGYSKVCDEIEIHNSTLEDEIISMGPADPAETQLSPGESMDLEPMGLHVMCLGVTEPLVEGSTITLELTFDETGALVTDVAIEQR